MTKQQIRNLKQSGKPISYFTLTREIVADLKLRGEVTFMCDKNMFYADETKLAVFLGGKVEKKHNLVIVNGKNHMKIITDADLFRFPDDAKFIFAYCQATTLNLDVFDTSNVTSMCGMFGFSTVPHLDLRSFDTSHVTNTEMMFLACRSKCIDLRGFNQSRVTKNRDMFFGCTANRITN